MLLAEGRALMKCTGRAPERKPGQEQANVMTFLIGRGICPAPTPSLE